MSTNTEMYDVVYNVIGLRGPIPIFGPSVTKCATLLFTGDKHALFEMGCTAGFTVRLIRSLSCSAAFTPARTRCRSCCCSRSLNTAGRTRCRSRSAAPAARTGCRSCLAAPAATTFCCSRFSKRNRCRSRSAPSLASLGRGSRSAEVT